MNAKTSLFVTCVEAIIYLLLYDLHKCTFNINMKLISLIFIYDESILKIFAGNVKMIQGNLK